jgi:hypothetical protein
MKDYDVLQASTSFGKQVMASSLAQRGPLVEYVRYGTQVYFIKKNGKAIQIG